MGRTKFILDPVTKIHIKYHEKCDTHNFVESKPFP
jgi:hypothetical protein